MISAVNNQFQSLPINYVKNNSECCSEIYTNGTQGNNTNFKGYNTYSDGARLKASSGKKWGVGVLSFFSPGVGQIANGQWGKGIAFGVGNFLALYATAALSGISLVTAITNPSKVARASTFCGGLLAVASFIGLRIWSTTDAVKNANKGVSIIS